MAQRLKVFVTSDGLTDYVVAVSSRANALAAWGVRQDVFKEGQAHQTDDPALVKAAVAAPGEVLRKPAGRRAALAKLEPAEPEPPAGPTKAQLKKVAGLEARLAALDAAHGRALAEAVVAQAALDAKRQRLAARHAAQREALQTQLLTARATVQDRR